MSRPEFKCQPWILTHSGKEFDVIDISSKNVDMEDIAHALGMLCRYAGHTDRFYSVAEHCVVISQLVSPKAKLYGLIHDAAEAYIIDLPGPVKRLFPEYKILEDKVTNVIYEYLGIEPPSQELADEVKTADIKMYLTERNQLMVPPPRPWVWDAVAEPFEYRLSCWRPPTAGLIYMETFKRLRKEKI